MYSDKFTNVVEATFLFIVNHETNNIDFDYFKSLDTNNQK